MISVDWPICLLPIFRSIRAILVLHSSIEQELYQQYFDIFVLVYKRIQRSPRSAPGLSYRSRRISSHGASSLRCQPLPSILRHINVSLRCAVTRCRQSLPPFLPPSTRCQYSCQLAPPSPPHRHPYPPSPMLASGLALAAPGSRPLRRPFSV